MSNEELIKELRLQKKIIAGLNEEYKKLLKEHDGERMRILEKQDEILQKAIARKEEYLEIQKNYYEKKVHVRIGIFFFWTFVINF